MLFRVVVVSVIIDGRSVLMLRVRAFLFVMRTPPACLGWLLQAGISRLGVVFGPRIVFPR